MKGTFFQQPFEFRLEVDGQHWQQGDQIEGKLSIKSHSSEPIPSDSKLFFALGAIKKVKAKAEDAFLEITPIQTLKDSWSFQLDQNVAITDAVNSPYLLYGSGDEPTNLGQLQLTIKPHRLFIEFSEVLSRNWSFASKTQKSKKDRVEFKMGIPHGKSFTTLDQLIIQFKMNEDDFQANLIFTVKKVDMTAGTMKIKKVKENFELNLHKKEFILSNGHLNKDKVESKLQPILENYMVAF